MRKLLIILISLLLVPFVFGEEGNDGCETVVGVGDIVIADGKELRITDITMDDSFAFIRVSDGIIEKTINLDEEKNVRGALVKYKRFVGDGQIEISIEAEECEADTSESAIYEQVGIDEFLEPHRGEDGILYGYDGECEICIDMKRDCEDLLGDGKYECLTGWKECVESNCRRELSCSEGCAKGYSKCTSEINECKRVLDVCEKCDNLPEDQCAYEDRYCERIFMSCGKRELDDGHKRCEVSRKRCVLECEGDEEYGCFEDCRKKGKADCYEEFGISDDVTLNKCIEKQRENCRENCESEHPPTVENWYRNAAWECYDGHEEFQGGPTSCKPADVWKKHAEDSCRGRCGDEGEKCGVNSFEVFNPCRGSGGGGGGSCFGECSRDVKEECLERYDSGTERYAMCIKEGLRECRKDCGDGTGPGSVCEDKCMTEAKDYCYGGDFDDYGEEEDCLEEYFEDCVEDNCRPRRSCFDRCAIDVKKDCLSFYKPGTEEFDECIDKGIRECKEDCDEDDDISEFECVSGCEFDNKCIPIGTRAKGMYCPISGDMRDQVKGGEFCENNWECGSNSCLDNECTQPGFWKKIFNWLSRFRFFRVEAVGQIFRDDVFE